MNAFAWPAANAAPAAPLPALSALAGQAGNVPLTRVSLAYLEHRFKLYLRFGEPARTLQLDRWRRCAVFLPGAMLCRIRWQANDYGTIRWQLMVMQACTPLDAAQRIPGVQPGARLLLHVEGDAVAVLQQRGNQRLNPLEQLGHARDVNPHVVDHLLEHQGVVALFDGLVGAVAELRRPVRNPERVLHQAADQDVLEVQADLGDVGLPPHADLDLPLDRLPCATNARRAGRRKSIA